jgi:hypothetical protein
MLQVFIPPDNIEERAYIINIIIRDFLGLHYELIIAKESQDYILIWGNKKLIIKDAFFSSYKEPLSYLSNNSLPEKLKWFTPLDEKIPIIYGENILNIIDNEINCGLDIFSSSFFMLSRWEELVIETKDKFGRCEESEMFIMKQNIYFRPLVCEYCFLLKKLLLLLNENLEFKVIIYSPLITHDVDYLFRYDSLFSVGQNIAGDLINRKSLLTAKQTISNYIRYKQGKTKDPFDTFDELMDTSEKHGLKSSFYFKPSLPGENDFTYNIFDERVKEIVKNIDKRGHEVGIHPSKNTFHNEEQFHKEVQRIRSLEVAIYGGRQHYLLYDVEDTFRYWENSFLEYDSGLGFYSKTGFRCGICWPFTLFDVKQRKIMKLIEKPLSFMEASILPLKPEPELLYENIMRILNQIKKYSGLFVFLWHNDGFNRPENLIYREVYDEVLKSL